MIKCFLIFFVLLQEVPLKPNEEFEIKLDYSFRQRSTASGGANYKVDFSESKAEHDRNNSSSLLPFLNLNIKMIKLSDQEVRLKGVTPLGKTIFNKKVVAGDVVNMELGFTDDLKDRVTPHEYNLLLISPDKKEVSRIHLLVQEDGTFLINGQMRGKF
jgi:hypothetical protein